MCVNVAACMQGRCPCHPGSLPHARYKEHAINAALLAGAISVLCATSTLAAGVNLPARRVIFKHAYIGLKDNLIDSTKYRQMAGRAGRAGIDTEGEAILVAGRESGATAPRLLELMQVSN